MSESLKSILMRRDSGEPEESGAIKQFILERFNSPCKVIVSKNQIVIVVNSSALAGTIRMHILEINKLIKSKRKLIIRIS